MQGWSPQAHKPLEAGDEPLPTLCIPQVLNEQVTWKRVESTAVRRSPVISGSPFFPDSSWIPHLILTSLVLSAGWALIRERLRVKQPGWWRVRHIPG